MSSAQREKYRVQRIREVRGAVEVLQRAWRRKQKAKAKNNQKRR